MMSNGKKLAVGLGVMILLAGVCALLSGCNLVGKNAVGPTKAEQSLFTVSTQLVERVEQRTNVVTVTQTNVVWKTNEVGVSVPIYTPVPVLLTNVVLATNYVPVPQLGSGPGSDLITGVGGAVAAPFGWGGVVSTALAGLIAGFLSLRNRALRGEASVASQTAGALTQNIQTLLDVLQGTPQGQAVLPQIKAYLIKHQSEAGVFQAVASLIEQYVDEPSAKASAEAILKAIGALQK